MDKWMLRKISDYWDTRVDAINLLSGELEKTPKSERKDQIKLIHDAIIRHVDHLNDEDLALAAFVIVDDLYKAANSLVLWDGGQVEYLEAVGRPFFGALDRRGFTIQYLIENNFPDLSRPIEFFDDWFSASGILYICPQKIGCVVMKADGKPESEYVSLMPVYIEEARMIANDVVGKCQMDGRSFVFLDTDSNEKSFSVAQRQCGDPGIIFVLRNEAPVAGSKCRTVFPKTARK